MFLGELPNEGLRHALVLQESTMSANHHTLLTPREHDVRSSMVLHEPRSRGSDDRDYDMVFFVSLEGIDVEHSVLPGETCGLQRVFDRVSLSVVGSDDFELPLFLNVTSSDLYGGLDLSLVLKQWIGVSHKVQGFWRVTRRTTQLTPFLISFPLLTSTKRQQVGV